MCWLSFIYLSQNLIDSKYLLGNDRQCQKPKIGIWSIPRHIINFADTYLFRQCFEVSSYIPRHEPPQRQSNGAKSSSRFHHKNFNFPFQLTYAVKIRSKVALKGMAPIQSQRELSIDLPGREVFQHRSPIVSKHFRVRYTGGLIVETINPRFGSTIANNMQIYLALGPSEMVKAGGVSYTSPICFRHLG